MSSVTAAEPQDAPAPAAGAGDVTPLPLDYRPAIDGMRSLAVYLVVAFHAGVARFSGGFIGVDVFFVLSGYLVTRVIFGDLLRGSFVLIDFYGRRVRRLLPAAICTLVVVCIGWVLLASPVDRQAILGDARSAALYYSNWHFAHQATDYFASNNNETPLLHFWSLSVEEQFYMAWPLAVAGLWLLARRSGRRVLQLITWVALGGVVASLVALALTVAAGNSALAYYGTHTRAYQLLSGVLLAVVVQRSRGFAGWRGRWASPLLGFALVGLVVLATSVVDVGPSWRGVGAAVLALAAIAGIEGAPAAMPARLLSVQPIAFLGKISYGTYLWHFPIIIVLHRFVSISPRMLAVVTAVFASALAALSYQLLELPVRHSKVLGRHSRAVVVAGICASLVAGLVVIPAILHSTRLPVVTAIGTPNGDGGDADLLSVGAVSMAGFDVDAASQLPAGSPAAGPGTPDLSCTLTPIDQCIIHRGAGKRVLLLGDSHAGMLVPTFRAIGVAEDATVLVASHSGCPWQRTLVFTRGDPECPKYQESWYTKLVPEFDPDVIVLVSRGDDHASGIGYPVASTDETVPRDASSALAITTQRSLPLLAAPGRLLVVVEPVPIGPQNARSCLSGVTTSSACAFVAEGVSSAEQSYRRLPSTMSDVRTLDIDPLVCPRLPICDPIVDGAVVRMDHDHITPAWAARIAGDFAALLRGVGAFSAN